MASIEREPRVLPSPLILGQVKAGQTVTNTLLVRSSQAFKLSSVKPNRERLSVASLDEVAKQAHMVILSFKAPEQSGPFNAIVDIMSDLKDKPPVKIYAFAMFVP